MIKTTYAIVAALVFGSVAIASAIAAGPGAGTADNPPATDMKMTKAQCATLWGQALAGAPGDLARDKAQPYVKDFTKADVNGDKMLSQTEWMDACNQGWIKTAEASSGGEAGGKTSDRTPGGASGRTSGANAAGAAGVDAAHTAGGTSDRTPSNQ